MTREHIFRSSWKKTIDTSEYLTQIPGVDRKFRRYSFSDGSLLRDRLEDLFSVIVKRVCEKCNNEWMNDLDTAVEPWVLNPGDDDNRCDPAVFRRWAIKIALLRICYDAPPAVERADPSRVHADEELPEWRVFVGRTLDPEHRHSLGGIGPVNIADGGKAYGLTQVSWTLGHSLVTALRIHGSDEISVNCFRNFRQYNRVRGGVVREVLASSSEMPTVRLLPALPESAVQELVWLFTTDECSPFAAGVRRSIDAAREFVAEVGGVWHGEL